MFKLRWLFFIILFCHIQCIEAQNSLSLDSCQAWARQQYPLIQQYALIEKSKNYSLENLQKGYFPQINIVGQASYQSDVTQIPIEMPGLEIPQLSKDQYRLYGEITQPLTDLKSAKYQRALLINNIAIEQQQLEIELYQLKNRINQLYFGVLLINAQIQQIETLKEDLQAGIEKTNAAIASGVALKSSADILKVELLNADQRMAELKANKSSYLQALGLCHSGKHLR